MRRPLIATWVFVAAAPLALTLHLILIAKGL